MLHTELFKSKMSINSKSYLQRWGHFHFLIVFVRCTSKQKFDVLFDGWGNRNFFVCFVLISLNLGGLSKKA